MGLPKPNVLIMANKPVAIKHDRANQILMNVTTYEAAATFKYARLQVHQFWPNSLARPVAIKHDC